MYQLCSNKRNTQYHIFSIIILTFIIGHQVWLYLIQKQVLADLGQDASLVALDAMLTWVPLALFVLVCVVGVAVAMCCYGEPWVVIRTVNAFAV